MDKTAKFKDFRSALFIGDGQTHHTDSLESGTVVLFFSDGTQKRFKNIRRGEYFQWVRSGYDYRKAPEDVFIS